MIKLIGYSNFKIEICNYDENYIIEKSSILSEKYRLNLQILKQKKFYENNILENIKIPKIISTINKGDKFICRMEYIKNSDNFIDFLNRNNFIKIKILANKLIFIIESLINKCNYQFIKKNTINNKIKDIELNLKNNIYTNKLNIRFILDIISNKIDYFCNIKIPIGISHGDLTLSNILIGYNNFDLYLIDFLDSFIETPLFDIIKIRQDTYYYWSLNLYKYKYDKNKIIILLNEIDKIINNYFKKYEWYTKLYKYFQIINLLRVLQYSKNDNLADIIYKNIMELIISL